MVMLPAPPLRKQCGTAACTQVACPAASSNSSSPMTAVASPAKTSTVLSTWCEEAAAACTEHLAQSLRTIVTRLVDGTGEHDLIG
jgi:hypothetical protein